MQRQKDIIPETPKKTYQVKLHNLNIKKNTAIINSKKLPKDFFVQRNKQEHIVTTKKKIISYECSPRMDQIISERKIISQNMINLNHNLDNPNIGQVTSFFGFKPERLNQQSESKDNRSQFCDQSFEKIRINEEYLKQNLQKQKDHPSNNKYLYDNPSFGLLQIQPKCSIQLNSPQDEMKQNNPRQSTYRRALFDCTFAMKPVNTLGNLKRLKLLDLQNDKRIKGKSVHLVRPPTNSNYIQKSDKKCQQTIYSSKQNELKYTAKKGSQSKRTKNNMFEKNTTTRKCDSQHQSQNENRKIRLPPIYKQENLFP